MNSKKIPITRSSDDELLGYICHHDNQWQALTIFGYVFDEAETRQDAERIVISKGLSVLTGTWQYYDKNTNDWDFCVIKEASKDNVTVIKTNMCGYQDLSLSEIIKIDNPAKKLRK